MPIIDIPKYRSIITDTTKENIRKKLRTTQAISSIGPIDDLLKSYQRLVGQIKIGSSQLGVGDFFLADDLFRSSQINLSFEKTLDDLQILYSEAENIDRYLFGLRNFLSEVIDTNTRYINEIRARAFDFVNIDINSKSYTDVLSNNFNESRNYSGSNFPVLIDTDSERIKLRPIRTFEWAGYQKNRVNTYVFSEGMELLEEEHRMNIFSEDKTYPWYIITSGQKPINRLIKGIDFSDYDGAIVGIQLGFEDIRPINQIKLFPFSVDRLDIIAIMFNTVDTPRDWQLLNTDQIQLNDYVYEFNFGRINAKEVLFVLGQTSYLEIDEPYAQNDTRLSIEHIIDREIGKYIGDTESYKLLSDTGFNVSTPFKDHIQKILRQIRVPVIKNPDPSYRQYIIGMSKIEVNYNEYIGASIFQSKTYEADGNIINAEIVDLSIIDVEDNILKTAVTYDLLIGGNEYPITPFRTFNNDQYIVDANSVFVDDIGNKYTITRFIANDPLLIQVFYNGRILSASEYIVSSSIQDTGYRIDFLIDEVIPHDIVGFIYQPSNIDTQGLEYFPNYINTIRKIGQPNLIVTQGHFVNVDDVYIFPIDGLGNPIKSNPIQYSIGEFSLVEFEDQIYVQIPLGNLKTPLSDYDYTLFYSPDPLPPIHTLPDYIFAPLNFVSLPQRGLYFGVIRETHIIPGDYTLLLGDPLSINNDHVGGYKRGSIILEYNGRIVGGISEYSQDSMGNIQNKRELIITDTTIPVNSVVAVTYSPINPEYVANALLTPRGETIQTPTSIQATNIRNHNTIETFRSIENRTVTLNNVPYVDNKIISEVSHWDFTKGIFSLKNNVSITYEPVIVTIDNRKINNRTDYFTGTIPILSEAKSKIDTEFYVDGNKIILNRDLNVNENVRIQYYELAGEIGVIARLYRIDGTAIDLTPEIYNYTLLLNIRK